MIAYSNNLYIINHDALNVSENDKKYLQIWICTPAGISLVYQIIFYETALWQTCQKISKYGFYTTIRGLHLYHLSIFIGQHLMNASESAI